MAKNMKRDDIYHVPVVCSHPTTPLSGYPCRFGNMTGVALVDESGGGNVSGETTVDFGPRGWLLSVKGVNDSGNSAVAKGDALFYVDADIGSGTGFLSKKNSGYFFGFAAAAVSSGATSTIEVWHVPAPGNGTLAAGGVGTTQLADDGVTAAKLTDTLSTGFINLPLAAAREITTNDYVNTAGDAGVLSKNTTPILERVNGATDKKTRIAWAASNNDEIAWDFAYPPDLDDAAAITINFIALSAGATDTPVLTVSFFEGIGDTNAGGNTAALGAAAAKKSVTIAAGDVGAYPNAASVSVLTGAHTTDAVYLLAAWVEYTRK